MNDQLLPYIITAALYFLLGVRDVVFRDPKSRRYGEQVLVLLALGSHGLLLHRTLFIEGKLDLSLGNSLSLIAAVTVVMYWVASFRTRLGILQPALMFTTALLVLSPLVLPADNPVDYGRMLAFKVHLVVSLMAYGLFAIAAFHAVLMGMMEQRLHDHEKPLSRLGQLPSLVAMDTLLFQMILVGFLLLSGALLSGVFFSEALFGKPLPFNHKVVFSFISWFIYGGLLAARHFWGIRGRRAARWTLTGFAMLVVGYIGSKFVLEILLHRG